VFERTTDRALEVAATASRRCDLLEFRLDALVDPDPERIVAASARPVVITCRGEGARPVELLRAAVRAGAAFIDAEPEQAARLGDRGRTRLILSRHDFEGTPDLDALLDTLRGEGADLLKIVPTARGPADVTAVLRFLRERADGRLVAHPMGTAGVPGRLLAAVHGSAILYGSARAGAAAAPGQVPLRRLTEDYGLDRDLRGAAALVLLGGRLDHSVSPSMMNRCFRVAGVPALYVPWEVRDPAPVLAAFRAAGLAGAAVTIPHKERVATLVGELLPDAARTGAVNTVWSDGDRLVGDNTDLPGSLDALRTVLEGFAGLSAVIFGAGGAGRALAHGLAGEGARVRVVDLDSGRAARLAAEVGGAAGSGAGPFDLVVNCTPVGQAPDLDASPVPPGLLRAGTVVFDAVYNPAETRLLREAREAGCRTVPGMAMLARQGARQVSRWLGVDLDPEALAMEGMAALRRIHAPLVLVGMRGAGKSTVGAIAAARLSRPFVDLDRAIEERAAKSIPAIFSEEGEAGFRAREAAELAARLRDGVVLALGGGALDRPEAAGLLRERGACVVWLRAPAAVLATRIRGSDRPPLTELPADREVELLLARRTDLYEAAADAVVDAGEKSPEAVADLILDAIGY
jgi:3-dehydroquinate dehydratase/shikimate dehydrogenase